jgi:hypothetical protein
MTTLSAGRMAVCAGLLAASFGASPATLGVPPEYRAEIERAETIGTAIYVHDSAAARATDELFRRGVIEKDHRLRGWITAVSDDAHAIVVTFVGDEDGKPSALYRIAVPTGDKALDYQALKPAQPLTDAERASYAARTLAIAELKKEESPCAEQYNTVVLSDRQEPHAQILVYVLAATDKPGVVVAGGHILYTVSPDGARILAKRMFTKSCILMSPEDAPKGNDVAGLVLTQLLGETPTEIHVFLSRLHRKPIFVGTSNNDLVWKVDGSHIELMDTKKR